MGSTSDFDGLYRIDNVDPGKYTLDDQLYWL